MRRAFCALFVIVLTVLNGLPVRAQSNPGMRYVIEDLGTLGTLPELTSYVTGINAKGQVSGYAQTDAGGRSFFLFAGPMA